MENNQFKIELILQNLAITMVNILFFSLGPLVILSLSRISQIGWKPVMGLHLFLFILFSICFIFKRKISYRVSGGATIFLFVAVGLGAMLHNQNIVYGSSYFVVSSLFAMLFFSLRGSLLLLLLIGIIQTIVLNNIEDTIFIHHILQIVGSLVLNSTGVYIVYKLKESLVNYINTLTRKNTLLKEAEKKAHVANQVKSQFLATITHELRTPLNGVLGATQILEREKHLKEQSEYINIIQESGNHLLNLINDFLDISKIEAGKVTLASEDVDLNSLFYELCNTYSLLADKKGIALESQIQEELPYVKTDELKIKQILLNLLSNSLKFTDKGSVKLNVTGEVEGELLICTIIVTDTGIGILGEKQNLLFEKFQQVDMSSKRNFGGTGLGLAITKELIELLNGSITFNSTYNIGSSFTIKLPLLINKHKKIINKKNIYSKRKSTSNKNNRILIVDDNKMNQLILGRLLNNLGYDNLVYAENGQEALYQVLSKDPFDLILMDLQMPIMDGYETTKEIRKNKDYKISMTPVIAVTANVSDEDKNKCKEANMDDFLSKPVVMSQLEELLEKILK